MTWEKITALRTHDIGGKQPSAEKTQQTLQCRTTGHEYKFE
jgi:hypothetical protein